MEIAKLILEYIQALVWPLIVAGGLIYFREPIRKKLSHIKDVEAPGGFKATFRDEVNEAVRETVSAQAEVLDAVPPADTEPPATEEVSNRESEPTSEAPAPTRTPAEADRPPTRRPESADPNVRGQPMDEGPDQSPSRQRRRRVKHPATPAQGRQDDISLAKQRGTPPAFDVALRRAQSSPAAGAQYAELLLVDYIVAVSGMVGIRWTPGSLTIDPRVALADEALSRLLETEKIRVATAKSARVTLQIPGIARLGERFTPDLDADSARDFISTASSVANLIAGDLHRARATPENVTEAVNRMARRHAEQPREGD